MFFNVVDAYTYKHYTDAITWPLIRLTNACQCKLPVTYNLIAKRGVGHSIIKTINQAPVLIKNKIDTFFMASRVSLKKVLPTDLRATSWTATYVYFKGALNPLLVLCLGWNVRLIALSVGQWITNKIFSVHFLTVRVYLKK